MELDFSDKIKEYFSNNSEAARSGPKSGAQTPAKPSERKKGSSKNAKDSASSSEESSITFSDKVTKALQNKVKEHINQQNILVLYLVIVPKHTE